MFYSYNAKDEENKESVQSQIAPDAGSLTIILMDSIKRRPEEDIVLRKFTGLIFMILANGRNS